MWKIVYPYIFISSFVLSMLFVNSFRKIALALNVVDLPQSGRKDHKHGIPLMGGMAIYCAFFCSIIIHLIALYAVYRAGRLPADIGIHLNGIKTILPELSAIFLTATIIMVVGFFDDLKNLSASLKLFIEVILASIVYFYGVRITFFMTMPFLSWLITVIWIVGITNSFNLLDNMDGLSSGIAFIAAGIFFLTALGGGHYFAGTIIACFGGVLLGFLYYNFPPAKVFMGDSGSLLIGYLLSILTIINTYYTDIYPTAAPVIMPLLIMAVPIFDTLSVIYIRLKRKTSVFEADKNHISHRLIRMGFSKVKTLMFLYITSLCIGIGALLLRSLNPLGCGIVLIQSICILALMLLIERNNKK